MARLPIWPCNFWGTRGPAERQKGTPGHRVFESQTGDHSLTAKHSQTASAESKTTGSALLNRANVFEAGLFSRGIPQQTAEHLTNHHTELIDAAGKLGPSTETRRMPEPGRHNHGALSLQMTFQEARVIGGSNALTGGGSPAYFSTRTKVV